MKRRAATREEMEPLRRALYEGRYEEAYDRAADLRKRLGESTPAQILYGGACALFGLGHVHQAEQWVAEHGVVTNFGADYLYLAAYLEIHVPRLERALLHWTNILQKDPGETFADRLIDRLKRSEDLILSDSRDPRAFTEYVPFSGLEVRAAAVPRRRLRRIDPFYRVAALLVVVGALALLLAWFVPNIMTLFQPDPYAALAEDLPQIPAGGTVTDPGEFADEAPRFVYNTRDEAVADFELAREKIVQGKVNEARYILGKIELSNASFEIKNRASFLRDAIPGAPLNDFRDSIEPEQIHEEPYMYRGAQVLWIGSVESPVQNDSILRFYLNRGEEAGRIIVLFDTTRAPDQDWGDLEAGQRVRVFGYYRDYEADRIAIEADAVERPED